jgi:hypothetical protein
VGYLPGGGVAGLDCTAPLLVVCRVCDGRLIWPCRAHRASRCVPCSERYRRLLVRIAESRSASAHRGHGSFLTLTAPGEHEHARWIPGRPGGGGPCDCRVGDLAEWNAAAGQAWNRLRLGLSRLCPFEYFRVVEVQKRGALHLHVLLWSAEPLPRGQVQELALAAGFGCQIDLSPLSPKRHAHYAAKYATKATDQRGAAPLGGRRHQHPNRRGHSGQGTGSISHLVVVAPMGAHGAGSASGEPRRYGGRAACAIR